MFVIESVNFGGNPQPFVIVGGKPGAQVVAPANPLGPEGSIYYLCLPNLGYIVFSDAGPYTEPGVDGEWAVQFRSANARLNYYGTSTAYINVVVDGEAFTAIGPVNTVRGTVSHW